MPIRTKLLRVDHRVLLALLPARRSRQEGIDTEHIFGFMIGTDVGNVGEREFQTETHRTVFQERRKLPGGRPAARTGIRAGQEFPDRDWERTFSAHDINGVPGFDDRRQLAWQGVSVDFRYRFLDRQTAPLGLTLAVETHADRIDETTAAAVRNYGTEFTLAFDREIDSRTSRSRRSI